MRPKSRDRSQSAIQPNRTGLAGRKSRRLAVGKVAWVTGAASGMGAAHARLLAEAGFIVGLIDVDLNGARRTQEVIRAAGGHAHAVSANVAEWSAIQAAATELENELGRSSIVIANAGVLPKNIANIEKTTESDWRRCIDVNLTGAFLTAKAALPQLRQSEDSAVIFVSSTAGHAGFPDYGAYVASKHGVIGLMKCIATEYGHRSVRTYAICPGAVDTPILALEAASLGLEREELVGQQLQQRLLQRLIEPEEISRLILFLINDRHGVLNGHAVVADAGLLAKRRLL